MESRRTRIESGEHSADGIIDEFAAIDVPDVLEVNLSIGFSEEFHKFEFFTN
ncbi:MAG UNVERIFIED_CONTAM: hypothetical protein LVR18_20645 [Planctomycetaceae bacterium]